MRNVRILYVCTESEVKKVEDIASNIWNEHYISIIEKEQIDNILKQDNAENENIYEVMELIGKKRGAIISGGQVDPEKIAKIILDDFRTGKIGKITIEKV